MHSTFIYEGKPLAHVGYSDQEMLFTFEGDAIPSFTAPIECARDMYPEIFAQLSPARIARYEHSVATLREFGSAN